MATFADAASLIGDDVWSFTNLTYAFPETASNYAVGYGLLDERDSFAPLASTAEQVFEEAFSRYSEVSLLNFTEVEQGDNAVVDIGTSTARSIAWAYFPGGLPAGGDIWFNTENSVFDPLVNPPAAYDGEYFFHAVIHEMGHAMGLLHGHDVLSSDVDGMEYSVMTYRSYVGDPSASFYTNQPGHFAQSLMVLDIAALQSEYGANFATAAGNTTYDFDPNTGRITRDGEIINNPSKNIIFTTLWDGNGEDTLNFSEYDTDLLIDLRPGEGSNLDATGDLQRASLGPTNDAPFHFYVALAPEGDARALFENAIGGDGSDSFTGNAANNVFEGGLGGDRYTGLGGSDTFKGTVIELNGDRVADFQSEDQIVVDDFSGSVSATLADGGLELGFDGQAILLEGDFASATFEVTGFDGQTSIELATSATKLSLAGERFITTDAQENRVFGDDGNDVIVTSGGNDLLLGGAGFDVLLGGDGADRLIGGGGGDLLDGGAGADIFTFNINDFGQTQVADFITDFEVGIDKIELAGFGFNGLDDLNFQSLTSGDAINLGSGFIVFEGLSQSQLSETDFIMLADSPEISLVTALEQHRLTDAGDRFVTTDAAANEVFAGAGNDAVISGSGDDILRGEADDDVLNGGLGADQLIGGQGSDRMTGREGADTFLFTAGEETGFAADFITDFEAADTVLLSGFGVSSFAGLTFGNAASGDVTLELSGTHFVVFEGIRNTSDLANAFDFA